MSQEPRDPLKTAKVRGFLAKSFEYVIGIDEVGTGAWAGPIVVGAVVFKSDWDHPEVRDSKRFKGKHPHERRASVLKTIIRPTALYLTYEAATAADVDREGLEAARVNCVNAVAKRCRLYFPGAAVVVDGNSTKGLPDRSYAVVKADDMVPAVSAASILAKVTRDSVMRLVSRVYPEYKFEQNMGYGTTEHRDAVLQIGLCPLHRKSYESIQRCEQIWLSRTLLKKQPETPGSMPSRWPPRIGESAKLNA